MRTETYCFHMKAENRWRMRERNAAGWFQMAGIAEEKVLAAMLARVYKRTKKESDAKQRKLKYRVMKVILKEIYKRFLKWVSVLLFNWVESWICLCAMRIFQVKRCYKNWILLTLCTQQVSRYLSLFCFGMFSNKIVACKYLKVYWVLLHFWVSYKLFNCLMDMWLPNYRAWNMHCSSNTLEGDLFIKYLVLVL